MCAGAAVLARVKTLVFGAWNEEYGASGSRWDLVRDRRLNHSIEVISGVRSDECAALVRDFMARQRAPFDSDDAYSGGQ
jgi:tRNA(adenine34) deaminase